MRTSFALAAALICAAFPASADEPRRQLGPHQHGHGRLNIAIDQNNVSIELEAPGADIAGFEHEPSTPEQKAALDKAKAQLNDGLSLFKVPEAAQCKLTDAKIASQAEPEHADEAHQAGEAEDKHEAGEHHHHHSEFHVEYTLDCKSPSQITSMTIDYFKAFAGAQALTVSVIAPKGQSSYEVTRDNPNLDLAGIM
jgi:Protein of unknown function (DUF2796)